MAYKYWIKLYHETLHDRKIAQLDDRIWRRFIECLLLAGEHNKGGFLPPLDDMAWILRADKEQLETELGELVRIKVLEIVDGLYFVRKFADRQAKMSKAEYMRRLRDEEQKQEHYQSRYHSVTNGNAEADVDIEVDVDDSDDGPPGMLELLNMAFINTTQIPSFGMTKRDIEAGNRLVKAGAKPEDVKSACEELLDKNYQNLTGLASVENATLIQIGKRNRPQNKSIEDKLRAAGYTVR